MTTTGALYGKGLSFPMRVGPDGRIAVSEGEPNVRESLCILLRTSQGERVERPTFGGGLERHLYDTNDLTTLRLVQERVKQAIVRWEPRVALDDVLVAINPDDPRALDVTVAYTLIATGLPDRIGTTLRS